MASRMCSLVIYILMSYRVSAKRVDFESPAILRISAIVAMLLLDI